MNVLVVATWRSSTMAPQLAASNQREKPRKSLNAAAAAAAFAQTNVYETQGGKRKRSTESRPYTPALRLHMGPPAALEISHGEIVSALVRSAPQIKPPFLRQVWRAKHCAGASVTGRLFVPPSIDSSLASLPRAIARVAPQSTYSYDGEGNSFDYCQLLHYRY